MSELLGVDLNIVDLDLVEPIPLGFKIVEPNTVDTIQCRTNYKHSCRPKSVEHLMRPRVLIMETSFSTV